MQRIGGCVLQHGEPDPSRPLSADLDCDAHEGFAGAVAAAAPLGISPGAITFIVLPRRVARPLRRPSARPAPDPVSRDTARLDRRRRDRSLRRRSPGARNRSSGAALADARLWANARAGTVWLIVSCVWSGWIVSKRRRSLPISGTACWNASGQLTPESCRLLQSRLRGSLDAGGVADSSLCSRAAQRAIGAALPGKTSSPAVGRPGCRRSSNPGMLDVMVMTSCCGNNDRSEVESRPEGELWRCHPPRSLSTRSSRPATGV